MTLALLATDSAAAAYRPEWLRAAPGLEIIELGAEAITDPVALAAIDIAFFSSDVYPTRLGPWFGTVLHAPKLQWMHCYNAGVDSPVFASMRSRGVRLTTSSGASAVPIAHTAVMHLLAMTRDSRRWEREQRERQWNIRDVLDMEGRTVAVVGMGPIGGEVARLCAHFGMRPIGLRRTPRGDEPCETWTFDRFDELLANADDVVLAVPLTDATRGMLSAARLAAMKPGGHIVNVGRGELIDEAALVDALRRGHVGAAALDVFVTEPLPAESPLWDLPNVTVTPHSAGSTALTRHRSALQFIANLDRYARDEPLLHEVP